ncbi:hypothetical protein [Alkaliphilus transvaalensis]|uniref:hypothetical protein n=1 Tax=Alkaliphilus transvaalensis TaxID=114628 RepID=UPI000479C127|nr:hypothetical protein [Alkaliphilus transvaalensis]
MITEFTVNTDLKRVIEEQQIRPTRVKAFYKQHGILLLNTNAADLAEAAYTLFLGSTDMSSLQELVQTEKNYQKSTVFLIESLDRTQKLDDFHEELVDEINRYRALGNGKYGLEDVVKDEEGNTVVKFCYEKHVSGKVKFISRNKRTLNVTINNMNNSNKLKVDVRQTDSSDSKEFLNFIHMIKRPSSNSPDLFNISHITLDALLSKNKIEFFDKLAKHKFADWKLVTITGISVIKNESLMDDAEVLEYDESTNSQALTGISSAILKGDSLRNNEFVQTCLKEDFLITAMKYKYSHKKEAKSVIIDINFKGTDVRVNIDKTYLDDDNGVEYATPLSFSEQDEIIKVFQEASIQVYSDLLNMQKNKINK